MPGTRLAQANERLDQLVLAVAGDARDPEDLAAAHLQVDAGDALVAAIVLDVESLDLEDHVRGMRLAAIDDERDRAPDHELGELALVRLGGDPRTHDLAAPDDRDPVGDR